MKKWDLQTKWNESLRSEQRPLEKRTHIYASEIGKDYWERYQKMHAVPYSNPFEDRVLRKFAAGNWFEDQIGYVLKKIGILKSSQDRVEVPETEEHLKVTGKIDFRAGGLTDWNEARERIKAAEFPDSIANVSFDLIDYFEKEYAEGLEETIIEVKSVNSQVFWAKKDYLEEAYPHHTMQLYTYLRANKHPLGRIVYISKDDLTIKEIEINWPDERLEKLWLDDVKAMSNFIRTETEPPKPDYVVFDKRKKLRFQKDKVKQVIQGSYTSNWEIGWSPYLTMMTGFTDSDSFEYSVKKEISDKNAELKEEYIKNLK